jgi:hypothetical protein
MLLKIIGSPIEDQGCDRVANLIREATAIFVNLCQGFCAFRHTGRLEQPVVGNY